VLVVMAERMEQLAHVVVVEPVVGVAAVAPHRHEPALPEQA